MNNDSNTTGPTPQQDWIDELIQTILCDVDSGVEPNFRANRIRARINAYVAWHLQKVRAGMAATVETAPEGECPECGLVLCKCTIPAAIIKARTHNTNKENNND